MVGLLQIQMCLMHELIKVFWKSIEARDGFIQNKHFCDTKIVPLLQILVDENFETNISVLFYAYCKKWNSWFDGKDPWNTVVIANNCPMYINVYKYMKPLCSYLCMLAYHMKTDVEPINTGEFAQDLVSVARTVQHGTSS